MLLSKEISERLNNDEKSLENKLKLILNIFDNEDYFQSQIGLSGFKQLQQSIFEWISNELRKENSQQVQLWKCLYDILSNKTRSLHQSSNVVQIVLFDILEALKKEQIQNDTIINDRFIQLIQLSELILTGERCGGGGGGSDQFFKYFKMNFDCYLNFLQILLRLQLKNLNNEIFNIALACFTSIELFFKYLSFDQNNYDEFLNLFIDQIFFRILVEFHYELKKRIDNNNRLTVIINRMPQLVMKVIFLGKYQNSYLNILNELSNTNETNEKRIKLDWATTSAQTQQYKIIKKLTNDYLLNINLKFLSNFYQILFDSIDNHQIFDKFSKLILINFDWFMNNNSINEDSNIITNKNREKMNKKTNESLFNSTNIEVFDNLIEKDRDIMFDELIEKDGDILIDDLKLFIKIELINIILNKIINKLNNEIDFELDQYLIDFIKTSIKLNDNNQIKLIKLINCLFDLNNTKIVVDHCQLIFLFVVLFDLNKLVMNDDDGDKMVINEFFIKLFEFYKKLRNQNKLIEIILNSFTYIFVTSEINCPVQLECFDQKLLKKLKKSINKNLKQCFEDDEKQNIWKETFFWRFETIKQLYSVMLNELTTKQSIDLFQLVLIKHERFDSTIDNNDFGSNILREIVTDFISIYLQKSKFAQNTCPPKLLEQFCETFFNQFEQNLTYFKQLTIVNTNQFKCNARVLNSSIGLIVLLRRYVNSNDTIDKMVFCVYANLQMLTQFVVENFVRIDDEQQLKQPMIELLLNILKLIYLSKYENCFFNITSNDTKIMFEQLIIDQLLKDDNNIDKIIDVLIQMDDQLNLFIRLMFDKQTTNITQQTKIVCCLCNKWIELLQTDDDVLENYFRNFAQINASYTFQFIEMTLMYCLKSIEELLVKTNPRLLSVQILKKLQYGNKLKNHKVAKIINDHFQQNLSFNQSINNSKVLIDHLLILNYLPIDFLRSDLSNVLEIVLTTLHYDLSNDNLKLLIETMILKLLEIDLLLHKSDSSKLNELFQTDERLVHSFVDYFQLVVKFDSFSKIIQLQFDLIKFAMKDLTKFLEFFQMVYEFLKMKFADDENTSERLNLFYVLFFALEKLNSLNLKTKNELTNVNELKQLIKIRRKLTNLFTRILNNVHLDLNEDDEEKLIDMLCDGIDGERDEILNVYLGCYDNSLKSYLKSISKNQNNLNVLNKYLNQFIRLAHKQFNVARKKQNGDENINLFTKKQNGDENIKHMSYKYTRKNNVVSCTRLFSTIIRFSDKIMKLDNSNNVFENRFFEIDLLSNISIKHCSIYLEFIQFEQFNQLVLNLFKQTKLHLNDSGRDSKWNNVLEMDFKFWNILVKCKVNAKKSEFRLNLIEQHLLFILLNYLIHADVDESFLLIIYQFVDNIIKSTSQIKLTITIHDMIYKILMSASKISDVIVAKQMELLESLIVYRNAIIIHDNRLPIYLQYYRYCFNRFIQNIDCSKSTINHLTILYESAYLFERVNNKLSKYNKDIKRLAPYLIIDILKDYHKIALLNSNQIQLHIDNSLYELLTVCDNYAMGLVLAMIPTSSKQQFKNLREQYNKYHRFTGTA